MQQRLQWFIKIHFPLLLGNIVRLHFPDSSAVICYHMTNSCQWNEKRRSEGHFLAYPLKLSSCAFPCSCPHSADCFGDPQANLSYCCRWQNHSQLMCLRPVESRTSPSHTHRHLTLLPGLLPEQENFSYVEPVHIWVYLLLKLCLL